MRHTAVLVTYSGAIAGSLALLLLTACTSALSPAPPASPAVTSTATPADALASRAGRAAPDPAAGGRSTTVTITAVGDTMLGNTPDLPPDPGAYFDAVESILRAGSPIAFANLEGTLTTSTASKCGAQKPQKPHKPQKPQKPQKPKKNRATTCFAFRDPPGYALYFKQAGFSVLNDANNHSFDFGAAGQAQTVRAIRAAGLAQTGLPACMYTTTTLASRSAFSMRARAAGRPSRLAS